MGKKKFIHKKQAATYRLVYKESSSATCGDAADRVFVRVDGGSSVVPGFDAETADEEELDDWEPDERTVGAIPANARQEILELGFPDDGYNYLQHLRDVGPSGRTGCFVPTNHVRLDKLRPDVKAFDASKVQIPLPTDGMEISSFEVSGGSRRIRGPISKLVDIDVAAMLDKDDELSLVSGDELEDDFVALANEAADDFSTEESGSEGDNFIAPKLRKGSLDAEENNGIDHHDLLDEEELKRPTRFLDEQFELLALREYNDDEIGDLDEDDLTTQGPVTISKFASVISDSISTQDKYKTLVELEVSSVDENERLEFTKNVEKANESCSLFMPILDKESILASVMLDESVPSDDEKELVLASDSESDEARWDCESIVSTYTNLDNHPGMICAVSKDMGVSLCATKDNQSTILLRGKQQLPVDYLPRRGCRQRDVQTKRISKDETVKPVKKRIDETKEEKKFRKVAVKEEKRCSRELKKGMRLVYKGESQRAQRTAAFTGPATLQLG